MPKDERDIEKSFLPKVAALLKPNTLIIAFSISILILTFSVESDSLLYRSRRFLIFPAEGLSTAALAALAALSADQPRSIKSF